MSFNADGSPTQCTSQSLHGESEQLSSWTLVETGDSGPESAMLFSQGIWSLNSDLCSETKQPSAEITLLIHGPTGQDQLDWVGMRAGRIRVRLEGQSHLLCRVTIVAFAENLVDGSITAQADPLKDPFFLKAAQLLEAQRLDPDLDLMLHIAAKKDATTASA